MDKQEKTKLDGEKKFSSKRLKGLEKKGNVLFWVIIIGLFLFFPIVIVCLMIMYVANKIIRYLDSRADRKYFRNLRKDLMRYDNKKQRN